MIRALALAVLLALGFASRGEAQGLTAYQAQLYPQVNKTYAGPVDNLGTAAQFYSCSEAMSTAYAAGGGAGCTVCLPSDVHCEPLSFGTNGKLVLGTFTGACTIAGGGTICTIKIYVNQANPGTSDETQTTIAQRDLFVPAAASNGCPSISWACATAAGGQYYSATITAISAPASVAALFNPTTTSATVISDTTTALFLGESASANTGQLNCPGFNFSAGLTENAAHSVQGFCASGASGLVVDGSVTTNATATSGSTSTTLSLDAFSAGNFPYSGSKVYQGIWLAAFNSTQYGNQHAQDHARFGTP